MLVLAKVYNPYHFKRLQYTIPPWDRGIQNSRIFGWLKPRYMSQGVQSSLGHNQPVCGPTLPVGKRHLFGVDPTARATRMSKETEVDGSKVIGSVGQNNPDALTIYK